jgi:hypothetical protein
MLGISCLGGFSETSGSYLQSVELYNWRTGQQCQLPNLPSPVYASVAVSMNGTLAYCGGDKGSGNLVQQCFRLDKTTNTWVQVSVI